MEQSISSEASLWVDREPWQIIQGDGQVVATAIHAGHDVRPDVARYMALSEEDRRREEDPLTEIWTTVGDSSVVVFRSRFELDLNRARDAAIVRFPETAWGLNVWRELPPDEVLARSLQEYDAFYQQMGEFFDNLVERWHRVLVLDVHSYNHRRDGPFMPPARAGSNPDINIGTGTMQRETWAELIDTFIAALRDVRCGGVTMDVRENTKFRGGHFPAWLHTRFPDSVCTLSVECKKTFMDEWTAQASIAYLEDLRRAFLYATAAARAVLVHAS